MRRPRSHGRRLLGQATVAAAVICIAAAVAACTYVLYQVDKFAVQLQQMPKLDLHGAVKEPDLGEPQTIMLLGSDARWHQGSREEGRSDTIILVRLDPDADVIGVLSIPRDLKVRIPQPDGTTQTAKINAAYEAGGPKLTTEVVSDTLGIDINHVVEVSFRGFRAGVNAIGCVYTDVDRRYFNPPNTGWAAIDVHPGYQRLCGSDALDYVRFRHLDHDLVRAARQQAFLRQARQQVSAKGLLDQRDRLLEILVRYARSDVSGREDLIELLQLATGVAGKPVRQIPFPAKLGPSYVEASADQLRAVGRKLLAGRPVPAARKPASPRRSKRSAPAAAVAGVTASPVLRQAAAQVTGMRAYAPVKVVSGSSLSTVRSYDIVTQTGRRYPSYRIVADLGGVSGFYGAQGTTWSAPPILTEAAAVRKVNGRKIRLVFAGDRIVSAIWQPRSGGTYWVQNTLTFRLKNRQMLALAAALKPAP